MRDIRENFIRGALCLVAGAAAPALAQNPCTVQDRSREVFNDCSFVTWQGIVECHFGDATNLYGVGWFQGRNDCDPGGLNCDGSSRPFRLYKATKSLQQWPQWQAPDTVQFWWNVDDQYTNWESCWTPTGESANRVTNYSFTHSTSWYQIWCD